MKIKSGPKNVSKLSKHIEKYNLIITKNSNEPPSNDYQNLRRCRAVKDSKITRHKYNIIDKKNIRCVDCGHQIENTNNAESKINLPRKKIEYLEVTKHFGDITIYRAYFTKKVNKNRLIRLEFPGISYVGQTIENATRRLIYGHIKNAFNEKKKHTYFENSINHNFHIKDLAKKYVKLEILQIIRFQGDINEIRDIDISELKKEKLELAMKSTQILADNVERFWIGFYKTQFKEFGRNIHEGGKENRMVLLNPLNLENAIKSVMHLHRKKGPFKIIEKQLKTTRAILTNNILLYYGKYLKDVKHDLILKETKKLFQLGYLAPKIAEILHLEGEIENASKTICEWIRNEIYSIKFPNKPPYRCIRDVVLSEIITEKVKNGIVSYESLLKELPGFEVDGDTKRKKTWELKRFVVRNLGGIKKLNRKYHPKQKKDYFNQALELIKEHDRTYSDFNLVMDLGFIEDFNYSKDSLKKNAGRALKAHIGKSMADLRNDSFKVKDQSYYLNKAIQIIRACYKKKEKISASALALKLNLHNDFGYSKNSIQKNAASRYLPKYTGKTFKELFKIAFNP